MQSKHPLQSKTVYGLITACVAVVIALFATMHNAPDVAIFSLTTLAPIGLALAGYGRVVANTPLSLTPNSSKTRSGLLVALLLTPLMLMSIGCKGPGASTAADQGTSSGWTDAQGQNVTVNFYASGSETAAEAVEGDDVPAGRIVLAGSTINVTVTVGAEGAAESQRGDTGATNAPEINPNIDVSPLP